MIIIKAKLSLSKFQNPPIKILLIKEQIALSINVCSICKERRIGMKISNEVCKRCSIYQSILKLYSEDNNMNPNQSPPEISD
jgi:ribosomal protein L32